MFGSGGNCEKRKGKGTSIVGAVRTEKIMR